MARANGPSRGFYSNHTAGARGRLTLPGIGPGVEGGVDFGTQYGGDDERLINEGVRDASEARGRRNMIAGTGVGGAIGASAGGGAGVLIGSMVGSVVPVVGTVVGATIGGIAGAGLGGGAGGAAGALVERVRYSISTWRERRH